jgi:large subunit ribosomal protein L25
MAEDNKGENIMSEFATLQAKKRTKTGKGIARRLRASAQIPAIFYTSAGQNIPLQINEKELTLLYQNIRTTSIFNLEIDDDGKKEISPALFWDVDFFPTKKRIQHVDIYGVDLDKELTLRVPLEFTGVAKGTKLGGRLETYREIIAVICKPLSLPTKITVDITELDLNHSLHIEDLIMPEGVRPVYKNNYVVVSVLTKSVEIEEETEAAPAAAATPAAAPAAAKAAPSAKSAS